MLASMSAALGRGWSKPMHGTVLTPRPYCRAGFKTRARVNGQRASSNSAHRPDRALVCRHAADLLGRRSLADPLDGTRAARGYGTGGAPSRAHGFHTLHNAAAAG